MNVSQLKIFDESILPAVLVIFAKILGSIFANYYFNLNSISQLNSLKTNLDNLELDIEERLKRHNEVVDKLNTLQEDFNDLKLLKGGFNMKKIIVIFGILLLITLVGCKTESEQVGKNPFIGGSQGIVANFELMGL